MMGEQTNMVGLTNAQALESQSWGCATAAVCALALAGLALFGAVAGAARAWRERAEAAAGYSICERCGAELQDGDSGLACREEGAR
jgi:hypothetical protein